MAARSRGPRRTLEATVLDGRGPLERLSRLSAGGTFREPTLARSTRSISIGADDMAHALSFVEDPLMQSLALALACQTASEWPSIQALALPRILVDLGNSVAMRGLVADHRRYRARLVLYDVFHDLALLRPVRPWKVAAAGVRMNESVYRELYEWIAGYIETVAAAGAAEAVRALRDGR